MQHIETGVISTNKLYPITNCRSSQATGIFLCNAADLSSFVQRSPPPAVISQDKVAKDFLGIADVL